MKSIVIAGLILSLTGCTTSEQLAKNLSEKSVSGSGLIADNRIGVDENKIPTLKSVFISGELIQILLITLKRFPEAFLMRKTRPRKLV